MEKTYGGAERHLSMDLEKRVNNMMAPALQQFFKMTAKFLSYLRE